MQLNKRKLVKNLERTFDPTIPNFCIKKKRFFNDTAFIWGFFFLLKRVAIEILLKMNLTIRKKNWNMENINVKEHFLDLPFFAGFTGRKKLKALNIYMILFLWKKKYPLLYISRLPVRATYQSIFLKNNYFVKSKKDSICFFTEIKNILYNIKHYG